MQHNKYSLNSQNSRGRRFIEEKSAYRDEFQRDRDRIIHCNAFRRLEYKTQVFVNHEGDHFRTRLTHSLEVAQIARSIARTLHLNEDMAESYALAHDLGHTPFGHAGEDALSEVMQDYGGFDHNAQTLRILTKLEKRYARFDGLNLCWETLEGLAKHNGKVSGELPRALKEVEEIYHLDLHKFPALEAQIAAFADDIAYHNHDIEDGIRAGLFTPDMLEELPFAGDALKKSREKFKGVDEFRIIYEFVREMIGQMVFDLIQQTKDNIARFGIETLDDVRNADSFVVNFSSEMQEFNLAIKKFLMENMYRHYKVNRMTSKARRIVRDLFLLFHSEYDCLPTNWRLACEGVSKAERAVIVCDFIAGMTDRFAIDEYNKVCVNG